jgi:hypothetical protein
VRMAKARIGSGNINRLQQQQWTDMALFRTVTLWSLVCRSNMLPPFSETFVRMCQTAQSPPGGAVAVL